MHSRCRHRTARSYPNYGGRGIAVCERWGSFENFLADMGPRPSPRHSIDRIDVNGNYEPSNCRWATRIEQARNTRKNRIITVGGATMCLAEWSEMTGVDDATIVNRLDRGWDEWRAVFEPPSKNPIRGCSAKSIKLSSSDAAAIRSLRAAGAKTYALCAQYGVSPTTIQRIVSGRSWVDARIAR